mgnify:CR=1 FL=1
MKKIREFISEAIILLAYGMCRIATWIDPSQAPEDGWGW